MSELGGFSYTKYLNRHKGDWKWLWTTHEVHCWCGKAAMTAPSSAFRVRTGKNCKRWAALSRTTIWKRSHVAQQDGTARSPAVTSIGQLIIWSPVVYDSLRVREGQPKTYFQVLTTASHMPKQAGCRRFQAHSGGNPCGCRADRCSSPDALVQW